MTEKIQSLLLLVMAVLVVIYIVQVVIEKYKKKPIKKDDHISIKPASQIGTTPNPLIKCKECGKEVSKKAKTCPNCGVSNPGISNKDYAIGCLIVVIFFVIIVAWPWCGSEKKESGGQTESTQQAEKTVKEETTPKLTPEEIECEKAAGPKPYQSAWDAEVRCVDKFMQNNLNDPSSLEYIEWSPVMPSPSKDLWMVRVKYRAKNAFGGYVVEQKLAFIKNEEVVNIIDYK